MNKSNQIAEELNADQLIAQTRNTKLVFEEREKSLLQLAGVYTTAGDKEKASGLLSLAEEMAVTESKMYLAKLLKMLLDKVSEHDDQKHDIELEICHQILQWSIKEDKNFLRYKLQTRYANILYLRGEFTASRQEIGQVIEEARKTDDKNLLVEAHLLEAKLIYETRNISKAKAALTTSRATANKIYIQPVLQADIERTAGIIHLAEQDYQISYSYFFESFEAFHQAQDKKNAVLTFNYLLLTKIMQDKVDDASNLVTGRYGLVYAQEAGLMMEILEAYKKKSLVDLSVILDKRKAEISANDVVASQIDMLYDQLLEKNIENLIMAYSKIQLEYLSQKLKVTVDVIERKICEMILDSKLMGSLDQENGILIIFENKEVDELYSDSLEVFGNMKEALDMLEIRAEKVKVN